MKSIQVATCQFSVEPEIAKNRRQILKQMKTAYAAHADVVHFSECALSGYLGVDVPHVEALNWEELRAATQEIQAKAKEYRQWVLLGSTHQLSGRNKPHNCVYVINPQGKIVNRYDKRFCTGTGGRKPTMDLSHYSPGNRAVTFRVKGVTCGVLICYDYRFPELYRELKTLGMSVLFQSFHNARTSVVDDDSYDIWKTIVPSTMACRAAENHIWVSANNSTTRPSRWASFTVRPDGAIVDKLKKHIPGVLITRMTLDPSFFDAPGPWRNSAINGQLHSGQLVSDPRSADVTCL
ncbi:MAG: carbon-nitrogen hydrolase family protein [Planctomycetaceae bacterium]